MVELIIFIIGFALGWWIQSWLSARAMMDILDDIDPTGEKCVEALKRQGMDVSEFEDTLSENSANTAIQLKVESVNGILMAYRAEDDFYVAQGEDAEKLFEAIVDKHPAGKIEVVEGGELVREYVETLNNG